MKRIDIIFNQALEEDVLAALQAIPEAQFYTLIPNVKGRGWSDPKMGDAVWPEFNELLFIYCEHDAAIDRIKAAITALQKKYTQEGLAIFITG
ncbi:MAG: hypothetical protein EWM51_09440 [Treponema sp.]|jgi:hypothetical protein|nr:MAG: hypothetical protein EWM51_09440 [Treponema sp.]HPX46852.1 hypothetical protein [Treponemataceae bacterium]